jgi:hypothetical protein
MTRPDHPFFLPASAAREPILSHNTRRTAKSRLEKPMNRQPGKFSQARIVVPERRVAASAHQGAGMGIDKQ